MFSTQYHNPNDINSIQLINLCSKLDSNLEFHWCLSLLVSILNAGNQWQGNPRVGVLESDGVLFWGPEMLCGQITHFSIQPPFGIFIPDEGCVCLVLGLDRCQMSSSGSILSYDMD